MATTHIAGITVIIRERNLRQRCSWCGEVLTEYDLANTLVVGSTRDAPNHPSGFPVDTLVRVEDGNPRASTVLDDKTLPDDSCALREIGGVRLHS